MQPVRHLGIGRITPIWGHVDQLDVEIRICGEAPAKIVIRIELRSIGGMSRARDDRVHGHQENIDIGIGRAKRLDDMPQIRLAFVERDIEWPIGVVHRIFDRHDIGPKGDRVVEHIFDAVAGRPAADTLVDDGHRLAQALFEPRLQGNLPVLLRIGIGGRQAGSERDDEMIGCRCLGPGRLGDQSADDDEAETAQGAVEPRAHRRLDQAMTVLEPIASLGRSHHHVSS